MTLRQIVDALAAAYQADPDAIRADVEELIDSLVDQRLLRTR